MSFSPLISLARNAKRQKMDMQCDPQWVLDLAAERDQLRAELDSIRGQEPVAWMAKCRGSFILDMCLPDADDERATLDWQPLYALPPQQPDAVSVPGVNEFAVEILRGALEGGSFDGGDIQEMGVKYGLLFPEQRTEPCCESGCNCAEFGFPAECFRIARALLSTRQAEEGE